MSGYEGATSGRTAGSEALEAILSGGGLASPKRANLGSSQTGGSQVLGMTAGTSMRSQLDSISLTVHEVTGRMELAGRQLLMLEDDRDRMKAVIQTQDEVLNQKILGETGALRDDTNHKLALQVAENRRITAQLAKAQADINRLIRVAENLALRVQILEAHTGVST